MLLASSSLSVKSQSLMSSIAPSNLVHTWSVITASLLSVDMACWCGPVVWYPLLCYCVCSFLQKKEVIVVYLCLSDEWAPPLLISVCRYWLVYLCFLHACWGKYAEVSQQNGSSQSVRFWWWRWMHFFYVWMRVHLLTIGTMLLTTHGERQRGPRRIPSQVERNSTII